MASSTPVHSTRLVSCCLHPLRLPWLLCPHAGRPTPQGCCTAALRLTAAAAAAAAALLLLGSSAPGKLLLSCLWEAVQARQAAARPQSGRKSASPTRGSVCTPRSYLETEEQDAESPRAAWGRRTSESPQRKRSIQGATSRLRAQAPLQPLCTPPSPTPATPQHRSRCWDS